MAITLPNGYTFQTTFWDDFTIADHFGSAAIEDTYERAFKEWKKDLVYLTELCLVLNWKAWQWDSRDNKLCELYTNLYYKLEDYALDHLHGKDLQYFYRITD